MKILVLENDSILNDWVSKHIKNNYESDIITTVYNLESVETDKIYDLFRSHEKIIFNPNVLSEQFVFFGMIMFGLIESSELKINEIEILYNDYDEDYLKRTLESMLIKKKEYIEKVVGIVKIYQINYLGEKTELNLWKTI